jgi:DNA-binding MarR family transcriptional regulator
VPHHPPFQPLPAGWTVATADEYDLGTPFLLWRVRQATVTRLAPTLRRRRLTEQQWRCLRMLQFYGKPLSQSDLARAAGFYVTHIRRMVEHLYHYGAVDWFKSKPRLDTHQQRWKIGITPYGHKLIAEVQGELAQERYDTSAIFAAADRRALHDLLLRYLESIRWTPTRSEESKFNPLHDFHERMARHSQHFYQLWRRRLNARKEGRHISNTQAAEEWAGSA